MKQESSSSENLFNVPVSKFNFFFLDITHDKWDIDSEKSDCVMIVSEGRFLNAQINYINLDGLT